jgi:hypothetical protein
LSLFFLLFILFFPSFFLNLKRHSTYWFLLGSCSLVQSLSIFLKTLLCDMYIFLFFFPAAECRYLYTSTEWRRQFRIGGIERDKKKCSLYAL